MRTLCFVLGHLRQSLVAYYMPLVFTHGASEKTTVVLFGKLQFLTALSAGRMYEFTLIHNGLGESESEKREACSQHTQSEGCNALWKNAHGHTPIRARGVARDFQKKCCNF